MAYIHQGEHELAKREIPELLQRGHSDKDRFLLQVIQVCVLCPDR